VDEDVVAIFIPIVAIIMSLSIPIVFAIVDYRRRRDIVEANHKERMAAIERGMELPPLPEALFAAPKTDHRPKYLLAGMIWLFVGVALFVALTRVSGEDVAYFALIPASVGLALLIFYVVEGRKKPPATTDIVKPDTP
jgi:hypothetical protein